MTVSVNVVVLAGTIAADPVERRMPSGEECTEIRLSVPESGRRLLPLPVVAWHTEVGKERLRDLHQGDEVLVYGRLIRRFYRSGAGARSGPGRFRPRRDPVLMARVDVRPRHRLPRPGIGFERSHEVEPGRIDPSGCPNGATWRTAGS